MLAVKDLVQFQVFMKLLASRTGQLVNYASLSRDCGISVPTVRQWLSVLEAGHLILRLPPWFSNHRKKLVKTPKIYFVDTGLLCHLLGIYGSEELSRHSARGPVFENWILCETIKSAAHRGLDSVLHFWRDKDGHEVDLIAAVRGRPAAIECKSTETADPSHLRGLGYLRTHTDIQATELLAYAGDQTLSFGAAKAVPWCSLEQMLMEIWEGK